MQEVLDFIARFMDTERKEGLQIGYDRLEALLKSVAQMGYAAAMIDAIDEHNNLKR